jgi:hypothetical protein
MEKTIGLELGRGCTIYRHSFMVFGPDACALSAYGKYRRMLPCAKHVMGTMPVVSGIGRAPVFGHYQHTVTHILAAPGHSLLM